MFKKILVTLDGSRLSAKAIPFAIGIAEKFKAEIILLQVVKQTPPVPLVEPAGIVNPVATQTIIEAAQIQNTLRLKEAERYLRRQAKKFTARNIPASHAVIIGNPVETIIKYLHKQHIDLVVMTTHGRSGLKRAIIGSVADAVVRSAGAPVLVVRI